MFTVEWLKDGSPVHTEAMLGANGADVLKMALSRTKDAQEASGVEPDSLRITDHMTNQTTIEKITHA